MACNGRARGGDEENVNAKNSGVLAVVLITVLALLATILGGAN